MNASGRWFSRMVWVGIVANLTLAVPMLLAPRAAMTFAGVPLAEPLLWPRFAALLLILLSVFYVPAGLDPFRYRLVAWCAVGARLVGVIFFILFQPAEYHMFGYFDLAFFIPQLLLLLRAGDARRVEVTT